MKISFSKKISRLKIIFQNGYFWKQKKPLLELIQSRDLLVQSFFWRVDFLPKVQSGKGPIIVLLLNFRLLVCFLLNLFKKKCTKFPHIFVWKFCLCVKGELLEGSCGFSKTRKVHEWESCCESKDCGEFCHHMILSIYTKLMIFSSMGATEENNLLYWICV